MGLFVQDNVVSFLPRKSLRKVNFWVPKAENKRRCEKLCLEDAGLGFNALFHFALERNVGQDAVNEHGKSADKPNNCADEDPAF